MVPMDNFNASNGLLDAEQLRTFLAVARFKNVTKASDFIGRTQSTISIQIKNLEADLNTRLFDRNARGVTLTSSGEQLIPIAQTIINDLRKARSMFAEPISGSVRVGIPDDYGPTVLQDILKLFSVTHPRVEVSVQCAFSARFPDLLDKGQLDLAAFVAEPNTSPGALLLEEPMVWAAETDWSSGDRPVRLALFDRDCWWRDTATLALSQANIAFETAYSSESMLGIKAAIVSGLAVGVLAEGTVEPNRMRILDKRDGFPKLPVSRLFLARNPDAKSPAIDAMAIAIKQGFLGDRN